MLPSAERLFGPFFEARDEEQLVAGCCLTPCEITSESSANPALAAVKASILSSDDFSAGRLLVESSDGLVACCDHYAGSKPFRPPHVFLEVSYGDGLIFRAALPGL